MHSKHLLLWCYKNNFSFDIHNMVFLCPPCSPYLTKFECLGPNCPCCVLSWGHKVKGNCFFAWDPRPIQHPWECFADFWPRLQHIQFSLFLLEPRRRVSFKNCKLKILGLLLNDGLLVKTICRDCTLVYFNLQWSQVDHHMGYCRGGRGVIEILPW